MFTDSLRIELAGTGVKVGLVAPGTTSTEIVEDMKAHGQPGWDEFLPSLKPEDIARAIASNVEQPPHANSCRVHAYSASEVFCSREVSRSSACLALDLYATHHTRTAPRRKNILEIGRAHVCTTVTN